MYIRVTYDGIGIYEALRQNLTRGQWIDFLYSNACSWLPKPNKGDGDIYLDSDKCKIESYFTEVGYRMFKTKTLPDIVKVLDKKKIKVDKFKEKEVKNIVYCDMYQVVAICNE